MLKNEIHPNFQIPLLTHFSFGDKWTNYFKCTFSKTTVIQWHKSLTKGRSIAIITAWILMMGLFYYDFRLGFIIALFFSLLHVILEFPLNIVSIKGLFEKEK